MAVCSANDVANYLINFAREHGDYLTPLKLQKLMFYADAWHMVVNDGQELIPDHFEAWVHGPVVRSIYHRFNHYRWNPIQEPVTAPTLPEATSNFLNEVYRVFGGFSGYELEQLTHQEEPWKVARGSLPADAPCNAPISKDITRRFYTQMAAAN
ncbi:DUF4065 domain-containing protein [Pseudomonas stutzeri]|uniref:Panacea domain-containing protein n=1 Tax=Stutzerimonas stutzeri TaxID=316 RepID=UPI0018D90D35|nr:type II toxin-antitoxin system antitoxin SocA domain-containing protein [Stutzerimonas stutzeri]MBH3353831.1 DUF4065 domain-containing protein [Stutzerimonas stutzeri]